MCLSRHKTLYFDASSISLQSDPEQLGGAVVVSTIWPKSPGLIMTGSGGH